MYERLDFTALRPIFAWRYYNGQFRGATIKASFKRHLKLADVLLYLFMSNLTHANLLK